MKQYVSRGCRLSENGFHLTMAIKRNGVSGNRTVTNIVIDSEVEEQATFGQATRAYEFTVRIYFSLYALPLFSLPRTTSLANHSIKSIWGWRCALHARRINVTFTYRWIGLDRNCGNFSEVIFSMIPGSSLRLSFFFSLLQMDTPVQPNAIGTFIGSPNHTTNYTQVRSSMSCLYFCKIFYY